jgi:hypothetical protein
MSYTFFVDTYKNMADKFCKKRQEKKKEEEFNSFGLLLLFVAILPTIYVVQNASGQGEEATEQNNIKLVRQVIEAR